jgi:hypothetical protein
MGTPVKLFETDPQDKTINKYAVASGQIQNATRDPRHFVNDF